MFKFDDLDGMSRALMLLKQQEAKRTWKQLHVTLAICDAFGTDAQRLHSALSTFGAKNETLDAIMKHVKSSQGLRRALEKWNIRLDDYMRDMDTRLSDGTKWYNALDIQAMADSITPDGEK